MMKRVLSALALCSAMGVSVVACDSGESPYPASWNPNGTWAFDYSAVKVGSEYLGGYSRSVDADPADVSGSTMPSPLTYDPITRVLNFSGVVAERVGERGEFVADVTLGSNMITADCSSVTSAVYTFNFDETGTVGSIHADAEVLMVSVGTGCTTYLQGVETYYQMNGTYDVGTQPGELTTWTFLGGVEPARLGTPLVRLIMEVSYDMNRTGPSEEFTGAAPAGALSLVEKAFADLAAAANQ